MNNIIYNGWTRPAHNAPPSSIIKVVVTEEVNGFLVSYGFADSDDSVDYSPLSNDAWFSGHQARERAIERAVELRQRAAKRYELELERLEIIAAETAAGKPAP